MDKDTTEFIVGHHANESGRSPKSSNAGHGVGHGAAGRFNGWTHELVDGAGPIQINEFH